MSPQERPPVIAIVGPTASGKTSLSLKVAEQLGGEVIACDSRTVYRHFDIGTAKPSREEQQRIRHHLIDVAEPDENFTVAQFVQLASAAIADITSRDLLPIVCGGTGFYSRALLEGLVIPAVPPQEELRRELRQLAEEAGNDVLYRRLQSVDPQTAARLNPNDVFRIIRALEVFAVSGQPFSQVAARRQPPFRTIWLGLTAEDRTVLHRSARSRFEQQLAEGLMDETQRLYNRYGANQKMMHTVNYKQLVKLIEGQVDRPTAYEEAVHHNIQLARKQLIWFRANSQTRWFAIDQASKPQLEQQAVTYINESLHK